MKLILLLAAALFAAPVQAVEYKWTDAGFVEVSASVPTRQAVTIQPGFHAHTRTDGSTFIHGDENFGKAGPHAGVERPWPKTGLPGQTVIVGDPFSVATPCPGGVCPVNARRFGYSVTDTVQTVHTHAESHGERRAGPLRQIVENIRERRQARQANRQAGGGWFGLRRAGGCP